MNVVFLPAYDHTDTYPLLVSLPSVGIPLASMYSYLLAVPRIYLYTGRHTPNMDSNYVYLLGQ